MQFNKISDSSPDEEQLKGLILEEQDRLSSYESPEQRKKSTSSFKFSPTKREFKMIPQQMGASFKNDEDDQDDFKFNVQNTSDQLEFE